MRRDRYTPSPRASAPASIPIRMGSNVRSVSTRLDPRRGGRTPAPNAPRRRRWYSEGRYRWKSGVLKPRASRVGFRFEPGSPGGNPRVALGFLLQGRPAHHDVCSGSRSTCVGSSQMTHHAPRRDDFLHGGLDCPSTLPSRSSHLVPPPPPRRGRLPHSARASSSRATIRANRFSGAASPDASPSRLAFK